MTQINIIGQFLGSSGYDIHTRELAKALSKLTTVRLSSNIQPGQELMLTDNELTMLKREPDKDEINLIITNPLHWRLNTTAKRNWVYFVWEGSHAPRFFINEMLNDQIEYIICPSEHTKTSVLNSLTLEEDRTIFNEIEKKLRVIHHGVDLDLFKPMDKQKKELVFLANKGFRNLEDRGGIQYLLEAFIQEFSSDDKVKLILKLNPAYGIYNFNNYVQMLASSKNTTPPEIVVITDNMNYNDLPKLYNEADVFVSPTRAESFNLPCLEAMACGVPVITTNFGGQKEYVNNDNGWIIGGDISEVRHEVMYEGISWLIPDVEELKQTMRHIYNNQDKIKEKSQAAQMSANFLSWTSAAMKFTNLI